MGVWESPAADDDALVGIFGVPLGTEGGEVAVEVVGMHNDMIWLPIQG